MKVNSNTEVEVVFCTEKESPLQLDPQSWFDILAADHCAAMGVGLRSDVEEVVDKCQNIAIEHKYLYDTSINIKSLAEKASEFIHGFGTRKRGQRVLAVELLLIGLNRKRELELYTIDSLGCIQQIRYVIRTNHRFNNPPAPTSLSAKARLISGGCPPPWTSPPRYSPIFPASTPFPAPIWSSRGTTCLVLVLSRLHRSWLSL